ncbi:hypothetical protein HZ326_28715 [Fusarium oxysporum f. sp. albedinis]|nr:hypothetical protein HZ326_28715 [Fusarium oxysporum f. sp. albedinis]
MVHSKTPLDNVRTRVGSCKGKVTDMYIGFMTYPKWRFERYDHKVVKWRGFEANRKVRKHQKYSRSCQSGSGIHRK